METPSKPWKVEYAKSSRSSCKTCKNSIVKGNLRIAKMVSARQFEGLMPLGGSLAPTNTSGFLKILVADNFGMLPLQNEASEDLEEMEHISLALHDTLKYIKRAKARLDYLEAENEELKATQELVRVKLENEFASVPLMSHHHRELEVLAEDQKPLMEVTYQACQYKRMQELAQECMKKEITVSVVQDSKEQDHKDNLTNFHEPSSMDDVQSKP